MMPTMNPSLSLAMLCVSVLLVCTSRAAAADPRWYTPKPPYPAYAKWHHDVGMVILRVRTDATGRIVKAVASVPTRQRDNVPSLAQGCVDWALANWHGPPNAKGKMTMQFVMH